MLFLDVENSIGLRDCWKLAGPVHSRFFWHGKWGSLDCVPGLLREIQAKKHCSLAFGWSPYGYLYVGPIKDALQ